jgi:hypothetical protein
MDDALLNFRLGKERVDGIFEASQAVNAGNEDVLDAAGLEVCDNA